MSTQNKPNYWWSLLTMRCPRCRRGKMFENSNPWNLKKTFKMYKYCPECGQRYELEVGFWYGTGYVSYGIDVIIFMVSFILWWIFIGMSTSDNRFFWWMGINCVGVFLLQPWITRISRVVYLYFFVKYDPDYKKTTAKKFDYESEDYYTEKNKQ
jgi:uncharacterized protein (DUF983 family)